MGERSEIEGVDRGRKKVQRDEGSVEGNREIEKARGMYSRMLVGNTEKVRGHGVLETLNLMEVFGL